jgi:tRNA pseudouridine38-40 synthase
MRVLLRLAYDGTRFHGSARQPGLRTVESEAEGILRRLGAIEDIPSSRFMLASRTDAGVSAVGNALAVSTSFPPEGLVGAYNSLAEDTVAVAYAVVADDFDPRHATRRWYRYHLAPGEDPEAWQRPAGLFVGEHDFASFTRDSADTMRAIDSIEVSALNGVAVADFRARGFLWNMVRRIVAAMGALVAQEASETEVMAALRGERRVDLGTAPPEPLTLMAVEYGFPFLGGLSRGNREALAERLRAATLRAGWLRDVLRAGTADRAGQKPPEVYD